MTAADKHTQLTLQNIVLRRCISSDQEQLLRFHAQQSPSSLLGSARSSLHAGSTLLASPCQSPYCILVKFCDRGGSRRQRVVLAGLHETLPIHRTGSSAPDTRFSRAASRWSGTILPVGSAALCSSTADQVYDLSCGATVAKCTLVRPSLSRASGSLSDRRASSAEWPISCRRPSSSTPRRRPSRDREDADAPREKRSLSGVPQTRSRSSCSLSPRGVRMEGYSATRDSVVLASAVPYGSDPCAPISGAPEMLVMPPVMVTPSQGVETDVLSSRGHSPRQDLTHQTDYVWSWERQQPPPEPVEEPILRRDISPGAATLLSLAHPCVSPAPAAGAPGTAAPAALGSGRSGTGQGSVLTNIRAMCESIELARALASFYYGSDKPLVKSSFHRHPEVASVLEDLRKMKTVLVDSVERLQVQELEEALQVACMRSLEEEANAGGEAEAAELALRQQLAANKESEGSSSALAGAGAFVAETAAKVGDCIRQAASDLLGVDKRSKGQKLLSSGSEKDSLASARSKNHSGLSGERLTSRLSSSSSTTTDSSLGSTKGRLTTPFKSLSRCFGSSAAARTEETVGVLEAIDERSENGTGLPSQNAGSRIGSVHLRTSTANRNGRRGLGRQQQFRTTPRRLGRRVHTLEGGKAGIAETDPESASFTALTPDQSIPEAIPELANTSSLLGRIRRGRSMPETVSRTLASGKEGSVPSPIFVAPAVYEASQPSTHKPPRWRRWGRRWSHSGARTEGIAGAAKAFQDFRTLEAARQLGTELAVTAAGEATAAVSRATQDTDSQAHGWSFRWGSRRRSSYRPSSTPARGGGVITTAPSSGSESGQYVSTATGQWLSQPSAVLIDDESGIGEHVARRMSSGSWVHPVAPTTARNISRRQSPASRRAPSGQMELVLLHQIPDRPPLASSAQRCTAPAKGTTGSRPSTSGGGQQTARRRRNRWLPFRLRKGHRRSRAVGDSAAAVPDGGQETRGFKDQMEPCTTESTQNATRTTFQRAGAGKGRNDEAILAVPKNRKAESWFRHALSGSSKRRGKCARDLHADHDRNNHAESRVSSLTMPEETNSAVRTSSLPSRRSVTSRSHAAEEEERERLSDLCSGSETPTLISADSASSANGPLREMWLSRKLSRFRSRKGGKIRSPSRGGRLPRASETSEDARGTADDSTREPDLRANSLLTGELSLDVADAKGSPPLASQCVEDGGNNGSDVIDVEVGTDAETVQDELVLRRLA